MENEQTQIIEERKCKRCGSLNTIIRFKTKERVCRSCGFVEDLNGKTEHGTNNQNP